MVPLLEVLAHSLVVARKRLVCGGRDPIAEDLRIEDADQAVAQCDVGIEERERLARLDGLDPERGLAEFDREWIPVNAVDAVPDDFAERVSASSLVIPVVVGFDARDLGGEPPRRGQEEMARSAGRIDDAHAENRGGRVFGVLADRPLDDGVERGPYEFAHEARRRVVGATQLSGGSPRLPVLVLVAAEREPPRGGVHVDDGVEFEQALVDGPEFLGVHVPVVDAGEALPRKRREIPERADGLKQMLVRDRRLVEVVALLIPEQAAEGRKAESRRSLGKRPERDLETLPEVGVPVVVPPTQGAFAKPRECVAFLVHAALEVAGLRRV